MLYLDSVATTVFANINVATSALQNVLPVSRITYLALETSSTTIEDLLEATRMLAFVVFFQFW